MDPRLHELIVALQSEVQIALDTVESEGQKAQTTTTAPSLLTVDGVRLRLPLAYRHEGLGEGRKVGRKSLAGTRVYGVIRVVTSPPTPGGDAGPSPPGELEITFGRVPRGLA